MPETYVLRSYERLNTEKLAYDARVFVRGYSPAELRFIKQTFPDPSGKPYLYGSQGVSFHQFESYRKFLAELKEKGQNYLVLTDPEGEPIKVEVPPMWLRDP